MKLSFREKGVDRGNKSSPWTGKALGTNSKRPQIGSLFAFLEKPQNIFEHRRITLKTWRLEETASPKCSSKLSYL